MGDFPDADQADQLRLAMFPNGPQPPLQFSSADIASVIQCMENTKLDSVFPPTPDDLAFLTALANVPDASSYTSVNPDVGNGYQSNDQVGYANFIPLLQAHSGEVFGLYAPSADLMFSDAQIGAIQASVRGFATVEGASHYIYVDQTQSFVDAVAQDLAAFP
jgi:hypothetical protein